jgi:uncharacterized protein DUF3857/transglutaminase superfamily protein
MKRMILFNAFVINAFLLFAGDGDYAVSKIPQTLMKDANAVLRFEDLKFEMISTKEAIETNHYVITILNENGEHWADFEEYYDKLREISSAEGYLYDAAGKQLKKMKFRDLQDLSGTGASLMDDNRVKKHNFYYRSYPYTVDYNVEIRYNHTMFFPAWVPAGGANLSVEQSFFTIVCPSEYQFRSKAFNYAGDPQITTGKNKRTTVWSVNNLPAIVREIFEPDWHQITTMVITAPTTFQLGDYKGDMSSWQQLGKFQYSLNQGRDDLPENIKQEIRRLTDGVSDVRKKIQILYEYLQKNTRYISVQLGIGGWQPFDASYVAKKGYGDCKALSNYMHSILKAAGIRSDYTLIRAGANENYITDDFPSRQFNHAILFVPLEKDTVWLECTSQDLPTGYLSAFTADRYALAVDENGGKLVHTPKYGLKDNIQTRKLKATLDNDASLTVQVITTYKGLEQDDVHDMINYLSKDKVKEYLQKKLDFPTYELDKFDYRENKSVLPEVEEKLDLYVSNYASITGKRLFITPNVMNRSYVKLKADEERKYDIVLHDEYKQVDSVEIEIPKGYEIESSPQPVNIETRFGKYSSVTKVVDNKILYYRWQEQYSGKFPAKDYADLVKYYDSIYKADRNKIVFIKKETN